MRRYCGSSKPKVRKSFEGTDLEDKGHSVRVVIASASRFRQGVYRAAAQGLGYEATVVERGIDCVACLRQQQPDLLVLESFLPWGGCDGVLDVAEMELGLRCPVIVVAAGGRPADWLALSRFRIDDFLPRFPGLEALKQLLVQTLGSSASASPHAAPAAPPAEPAVRTLHSGNPGKPSEKRHLPEGSGLDLARFHASAPAPQLLAADSGMSVTGGATPSDPPRAG
jgi:CheY-like chemotaxis protein